MWYQWDSTFNFYLTEFKPIQSQTQSLNKSGFHNSFYALAEKSSEKSSRTNTDGWKGQRGHRVREH